MLRSTDIKVFTSATGHHNQVKWANLRDYTNIFWKQKPLSSMLWYTNNLNLFTGKHAYQIASFLYHYLPAHILDCVARLLGRKPRLVYFLNIDSLTTNRGVAQYQNKKET